MFLLTLIMWESAWGSQSLPELMAAYSDDASGFNPGQLIGQEKLEVENRLSKQVDKVLGCESPCKSILIWDFKSEVFVQEKFELAVHIDKKERVIFARWQMANSISPVPQYEELRDKD